MTTQPPTIGQVSAAWDAIAERFDQIIAPSAIRNGEAILDRVAVRPGNRLLDVACGSGALAIPAARRGANVVAVDIAPQMIKLLDARASAEDLTIDSRVMDAHALEFPDDEFDVAVSQNGITMSPQLAVALNEMVRVTRPGGTILVAALGPLPKVEFLSTFFAGVAAAVPGFSGLPTNPPPPPFQLADQQLFTQVLTSAGLRSVTVGTVTWQIPVGSGIDLWNEVTASNPLGAQLAAGLTEQQKADTCKVLDRVLRERFGGQPAGVLDAAVNVGAGTV